MRIRRSLLSDIDSLMEIFAYATQYMCSTGNKNQWINGYPSREIVMQDIMDKNSHVCVDNNGVIVGTFCFKQGEDPNYAIIDEGEWLNNNPYGVVHRIAGNGKLHGLADYCLQWCYEQCPNIRVDTHRDNLIMQHILERNGYAACGIIYVSNGTPRVAFQKSE